METDLTELEQELGHVFARPELLVRALTHRSLAQETAQLGGGVGDNERLEFLGDAVLGLVVADTLFAAYPEWREGELTRVRAQLVSRQHMAAVADAVRLGEYLRLSRGEERGGGLRHKATVLSNAMEAVIGALYLDGGLQAVRVFVEQSVMGEATALLAEEVRTGAALGNYKSALQEHLQAARAGAPVYRVRRESGPDHRKRFLVEVRLKTAGEPGAALARGAGSTKKHAEQDAARRALEKLLAQGGAGPAPAATNEEGEEQAAS